MVRGREMAHPERGEALLRKVADEIAEFGTVEQQPNQEGRNMTMVMAPVRAPARKQDRPAAQTVEGGEPSSHGEAEQADTPGEPAPAAADTTPDQQTATG
jgi:translation initiation factor IF-3